MKVIVTGSAGFIGSAIIKGLNEHTDWDNYGIDNFRSRSEEEEKLKFHRVNKLIPDGFGWTLEMLNKTGLHSYLNFQKPDLIIHMAATPGVRDSINNPNAYIENNILSFLNLLEYAKEKQTPIIYASSSTVYGELETRRETSTLGIPLSPYAFSKASCELLAETYHKLYSIPLVGLRFFTVYGPYGRPDMVYYSWTKKILNDEPITVNGSTAIQRSFTYIESVVQAAMMIIRKGIKQEHIIYNIGDKYSSTLGELISIIEKITGKKATVKMDGYQKGDALNITADSSYFEETHGIDLSYPLNEGMEQFINWYIEYQNKIKE